MEYDQRDRIMMASSMMKPTMDGWLCGACGALCRKPGHGHLAGCRLAEAVAQVAPEVPSDRAGFLDMMRMEAVGRLSAEEISTCDRLAMELLIGDDVDATLKEIGGFCGEGALESGVLRRLAGRGGDQAGVATMLMCERAWGRKSTETAVTPAVN